MRTVPSAHRTKFFSLLGAFPSHHAFVSLWAFELGDLPLPRFDGVNVLHPIDRYGVDSDISGCSLHALRSLLLAFLIEPEIECFQDTNFVVPKGTTIGALSDLLSTPLGSTALSPELRSYLSTSKQVFSASVRIPSHLSSFAAEAGLLSNPHAPVHGHPFHKALEEKLHGLLHAVVSGCSYTLLSRKETSAALVRGAAYLANNILTGMDLLRYRSGIFAAPTVVTPLGVLSDTLQMLTVADIDALFQRSPNLQHLFCSAVIAPEAIEGSPDFFPDIYTLARSSDPPGYLYYLEKTGSTYFQPDTAVDWLTCNVVHGIDCDYSVTVLETFFAHHIILISRESFLPQPVRSFASGHWVTIPALYMPGVSARFRRARQALAETMVSFLTGTPALTLETFTPKLLKLAFHRLPTIPTRKSTQPVF
jgi:hypothetical protein